MLTKESYDNYLLAEEIQVEITDSKTDLDTDTEKNTDAFDDEIVTEYRSTND